jgi:type VI secretion system ImpB/VipA family protein
MDERIQLTFSGPKKSPPDALIVRRVFAVIGSFDGEDKHEKEMGSPPVPVAVHSLSEALAQFKPEIKIGLDTFKFRSMEDFSPDSIISQVPDLRRLHDLYESISLLRRRLDDESTLEAVKKAILKEPSADGGEPTQAALGAITAALVRAPTSAAVENLEASDVKTAADEVKAEVTAQIDARLSAILNDPEFRNLEKAWRGLQLLIEEGKPDEHVQIFIVNAVKADLADEFTMRIEITPRPEVAIGSERQRQIETSSVPTRGDLYPRVEDAAVLETFDGFVDRIEGDTAFVTLQSRANGDVEEGTYPASKLADVGIHEQSSFLFKTVSAGDAIRLVLEPAPPESLSDEVVREIDAQIDELLPHEDPGICY